MIHGRKVFVMKKFCRLLVPMTLVAMSSAALAEVYKCDGPDGPIYTDRKCGPDATSVEFSESSGISGVPDEVKDELARKKSEREKAESDLKLNPNANATYQFNTINTEPAGYWLPGSFWRPGNRPPHRPKPPPRPPQQPPRADPSVIRLKR